MIKALKNIIKKYYKINSSNKDIKFVNKETKVDKIFDSISKFSETSEARYVGGVVRKIINNEKIDDIDLATNIIPSEVCEVLKKNNISFYKSGIDHGTITAKIDDKNFEVTTLRKDISTDGRHAKVQFTKDWFQDASRRDFTINAIYSDINGNLYDPFNGKKDLKNGIVKFIGEPERRIREDYLRIVRYIRFHLNYSKIKHEEKTIKEIRQNLNGVTKISSERLIDEFRKLVMSKGFLNIHKDNFSLEIIKLIYPELVNLKIIKNLNPHLIKIFEKKDFIFLVSLLVINDKNNSEYFIYKYNISNEDKKRIKFLQDAYLKIFDKNFFNEKNLWKIFYLNGRNSLNDLINFKLFQNKKLDQKLIKLSEYFKNQEVPKLDIKAKTLIDKFNFKEGKELGDKLKEIEKFWLNNSFKINDKELKQIINN